MRKQKRRTSIESLEKRLLLTSAPIILKTSDAVQPGSDFTVNGAYLTAANVSVAIAPESASASVGVSPVFEADFNGSGSGTGGAADIVASGGTGAVVTATNVSDTVVSTSPFSSTGGSYLNSSISAGANYSGSVVTFTPSSAGSSWNAITGSTTVNGVSYTTLNGAMDLLVRPNTVPSGNLSWFRPIDISNISGTTGMRLILNGTGSQLQFEALGSSSGAYSFGTSPGTFTTTNSWGLTGALTYMASPFVTGSIEHIGITFSTDSTGKITVKIFAATGAGAIDTTSTANLIGTQSFYASGAVIGTTPLPTGAWSLGDRYGQSSVVNVDYDSVRLYTGAITSFTSSAFSASTIFPQVLQTDVNGNFVVCKFPATSAAGVYDVWVENASGWSSPYLMNAARSLYQSDFQGYAGINIEVVGRNFDQSEFGGTTATLVRLNNGSGGVFAQTIASLNPYDVSFNINSTVPNGTYYIEISNDNGADWSRPSSGQTLSIIAHTGTDPLGLGVSWAQDFKWNSMFNVTTYGANGSDSVDDTTAVKSAINAANLAGGGIVYFPNGTYYISGLTLPSNVLLEGQNEYNTQIVYSGGGGSSFIRTASGTTVQDVGIARLSIGLSAAANTNSSLRPDDFLNFGNSASDQIVVYAVNLNYSYTTGDSSGSDGRRGIGLAFGASQQVLVADNHFVGWEGTMPDNTVGQYATIRNNYFEYSCGYVHCSATYDFFENNTLVIHDEYDQDSHGLFGRADAYFANNSVTGAGDASNVNNDGEPIATEGPNGNFNLGNVSSATLTSITVTSQIALTMPTSIPYGTLSIMITNGTGLGELEQVTGITPTSLNASSGTITIAQPFTIVPDATSQFTLLCPLTGMTVYHNAISNSAKGIYVYGLGYDDVVADNTVANSGGIYVHAVVNISTGEADDPASYFVRIVNNLVTGVSRRGGFSGIGLNTGRFGTANFVSVQNYGTEISYNTVIGNNTYATGTGTGEAGPFSGIYAISYGYSTQNNGTGIGDATNVLIQSNVLSDLKFGITVTQCDHGIVIDNNTYDNQVLTFLVDSNSVIENNVNYGVSDDTLVTTTNILNTITLLGTSTGDTFNLKEDAATANTLDVNSTTYNLANVIKVVIIGSTGNEIVTYDFINGPLTNTAGPLSQYGVTFDAGTGTNTLTTTNSGKGATGTMPVYFVPGTSVSNNLNAGAGTVTVPASNQSGFTVDTFSNVTIGSGAQVTIATVSSNHSNRALVVVTGGLSLAGSTGAWKGTLDLGGNDLDVPNGNLSLIASQIAQGFKDNWQASGGIISSAAASDTSHLTTLGVIQNSTDGTATGPVLYGTFDSATVLDTDVLVKNTYFGDANFDGKVDASDYTRIDNGFLHQLTGWFNGDLNDDGVINGSDYTLIDNAFNTQGVSLAAIIASPTTEIAGSPNAAINNVFANIWSDAEQRRKKTHGNETRRVNVEVGLVQ